MKRRTQFLVLAMTLVVASSMAVASLGTAGDVTARVHGSNHGSFGAATAAAQGSNSSDSTDISQCRVINESGHYDLTTDLETDARTCIEIQAADVTLNGNGHSITSTDGDGTGVLLRAGVEPPVESPANATITNFTVAEWDDGVLFENGDNGTLDDVTAVNASVDLGSTEHGTVVDSHVENGDIAAGMDANDVTVRNTSLDDSGINLGHVDGGLVTGVSGDGATVSIVKSRDVMVRGNSLEEVFISDSDQVTVTDNAPDDSGRFGVWIASAGAGNVTITDNEITGNDGENTRSDGIRAQSVHNLTVTNNDISGNENGIVVLEITDREETYLDECERKTRTINGSIEVHRNSLANNTHGIVNEDTTVVNAVNNYWGAENGPSSETTEPLEDPQTGELADGDGTTVSEHPDEPGVSNVRFDPWLDHDPTDDTENGSSN